jgi:hypothetical protein
MKNLPYPKSFPTADEKEFLQLIVCSDADFTLRWNTWTSSHDFDDVDETKWHLYSLIYGRLVDLNMEHDPLFGRIKGIYKMIWVRNQQILAAAKDLCVILGSRNIPVTFLKGIPMLVDVYQNTGARLTGDVDIFIPPEYAPVAVAAIAESGWKYWKPWMPDVNNPVPSMYHVTKSTDFINRYDVVADIHWNIFGLYHHVRPIDVLLLRKDISTIAFRDAYSKGAVPIHDRDIVALRLGNEDMLIHAVVHGSENAIARGIRWVTDAAAIMRAYDINWTLIAERAHAFGLSLELWMAFRYLHEEIELDIPQDFLDTLSGVPFTQSQIREFNRRANLTGGERFSPMNNLLMFWYAYWTYEPKHPRKTIIGFIRYAARSLGIDRPGMFRFIANKYARKIWRRLSGRQVSNISYEEPTH